MKKIDPHKIINFIEDYNENLYEIFNVLLANIPINVVQDIETAAISIKGEKRIFIGRDFLDNYIDDYSDLVTVILHELLHQLAYSEDRLSILNHEFENFVQDMWINSYLCATFSLCDFMKKFYRDKPMPLKLLSRKDLDTDKAIKLCEEFLPNKNKSESLVKLWVDIYRLGPPPIMELKKELMILLNNSLDQLSFNNDILKGIRINCSDKDNEDCVSFGEIVLDVAVGSVSINNKLEENKSVLRKANSTNEIVKIIYGLFKPEGKISHLMLDNIKINSVVPMYGRREIIQLNSESIPVFFEDSDLFKVKSFKGTGVYLDVSGSMDEYIGELFYLLSKLSNFISPPFYEFSNKIYELSLKDIKNGNFHSTLGTDLDCVIEHARENHFNNIIVITDGYWDIDVKNRNWMRKNLNSMFILIDENNSLDRFYSRDNAQVKFIKETLKSKVLYWNVKMKE